MASKSKQKIIAVDLDHTLCNTDISLPSTWERYHIAPPMKYNINYVNSLYDAGHYIVIYTARGMLSCNGDIEKIQEKYMKVTKEWLDTHSVKYHELLFGKMYFDYIIDDKAVNVDDIDRLDSLIINPVGVV